MTERYENFDKELREMYRDLGIKHLREVTLKDGTHAHSIVDVMRSKTPVIQIEYSDFKVYEEMDFITQDLKYITGILFLLRPFINNPISDNNTYNQTVGDRRYLMHVTFGLQAIYNFWDRIGDLLWHFFFTGLSERDVYFNRVFEKIPYPFNTSVYYLEMKEIYECHVKPVLKQRKDAVHYFQPECRHYWGHLENYQDKSKIEEMYQEKYKYAELMKTHLELAIKAFDLTKNLINELPNK